MAWLNTAAKGFLFCCAAILGHYTCASQELLNVLLLHQLGCFSLCNPSNVFSTSVEQVRNSYFIGLDGSLRLVLANGMEVSLYTEPHLLAGTVNPTVSKRNITLAIDNGLNLVEWRQRKEQARGQVTVYGRRLRVRQQLLKNFRCDTLD